MNTYLVKRIIIIAIIILVCAHLQACAVYTVATGASLVATQKSVGDHVLTQAVPNADCGLKNLWDDKYYCEVRDITATYNRWGW